MYQKFRLSLLVSIIFILTGCKKDDSEENNNGGSNSGVTPNQIKIELTLDSQTHVATFGGLGTSLQFNSEAYEIDDVSTGLSIAAAFNDFNATDGISYASIVLPDAILNTVDWNSNSSQAFINFFNGSLTIPNSNNLGIVIYVDGIGYSIIGSSTGNWKMNKEVESSTYPATVRCQGEIQLTLSNFLTSETFPATFKYVMRFQEPA